MQRMKDKWINHLTYIEKNMIEYDKKSRIVRGTGVVGVLRCELIEYSTPERSVVNTIFPTSVHRSIGEK